MEKHPSYEALSAVLPKYPRAAGALFQTYNDLMLAQGWRDLEVLDLPKCGRGAFRGLPPAEDAQAMDVVPCSLSESLSIGWIQEAFRELRNPDQLCLAINAEDSSIVYYKISRGIIKPPV